MAAVTDTFPAVRSAAVNAINAKRLRWLPLAVILLAQGVLSARLIPTGIASHDEAGYINAGHQLIHEFWHGGGSPYYETHFSGSPVIYPVLAAMADHVGGLVAVRLMSLLFMMAATFLATATGTRMFGYWPGILAGGLFAGLGLTDDLGAYATYDAMALMLIAAAAYCAVRAEQSSTWLMLIPLALLLANATKYASLLFDPIVVTLAALQAAGWRRALKRLLILGTATVCLLCLALLIAGGSYLKGILFSTLSRKSGTQSILGATAQPQGFILQQTWTWTGVILVLGVIGLIATILIKRDYRIAAIVAFLVLAGILVTAEAVHLHSSESMRKHDDYGAWFTCIAAGYALGFLIELTRKKVARLTMIVAASGLVVAAGAHYSALARSTYEASAEPKYLAAFAILKPYLTSAPPGARFLVGGIVEDQMPYTDHINIPWYRYSNDVYIKYPIPGRSGDSRWQAPGRSCAKLQAHCIYLLGNNGYRMAIHAHWYAVVSMIGNHKIPQDVAIGQAVEHTPGYVLLTRAGGSPTWIYAPAYQYLHTIRKAKLPESPVTLRHRPSALTILRGMAVTLIPATVYLAAGLLWVGTATLWRRREQEAHQSSPDRQLVSAGGST